MMRRARPLILEVSSILAALSLSTGFTAVSLADEVENPISAFEITVDGQFSDGILNGAVQGEWSDVTPLAFLSPESPDGQLFQVPLGSPLANSLLYAANAPGESSTEPVELYLMYDYLPRTSSFFAPGEFIADIRFPVQTTILCGDCAPEEVIATVQFRGTELAPALTGVAGGSGGFGSGVDIFVDLSINGDSQGVFSASELGMEGAVGFGPSTLSATNHMLIELEVPLLIEADFLGPGSPPQGGVYSPDPAFWGADIANDAVDPPASFAIFEIMPGGSVVANSDSVPFVPEPTAAVLAALAVCGAALARRAR